MNNNLVSAIFVGILVSIGSQNALAGVKEGRQALAAKHYKIARMEFTAAARKGEPGANYWLGHLYDRGIGVGYDAVKAFKLIRKAALNDVILAERRLGELYRDGRGVIQSRARARQWFDIAATDGDVAAQREMGLIYADGIGVLPDKIRAYAWFDIAARQGDVDSTRRRNKLAKTLSSDDIRIANALARRIARTIAKRTIE